MIRGSRARGATEPTRARGRGRLSAAALVGALLPAAAVAAQENGTEAAGARNAHWYMGNYSNEVLVWDEASEEVVDRIPVKRAISLRLTLSADRSRLYVLDPFFETIEVIALPSKESIGEFTLSEGTTRTWIRSFEVHPNMEWAALLVQSRTKLADRYEIDDPTILRLDLSTYEVTDTIPWPGEDLRQSANFRFSPDGDLLYMFSEDLVAVDSETFEEVDRWAISEPFETGLGAMSLPFGESPYQEEEGVYTGLFRMMDPVQNRRLMGFATVDLAEQQVDFHPIGPSDRVSFSLSADGTKGYGLKSRIGHYEMWKFDLPGRRVSDRIVFEGRPRMALMPSADGTKLYIYNAGSTIDVYDEETFELLRTVTLDADMTSVVVVPDPG